MLFEKAREHSPSIIIIDDLEYLQHKGNESEDGFWKPKQQLAAQINGTNLYFKNQNSACFLEA